MNAEHFDHQKLQELRAQKGVTQAAIADALARARITIHRAETGKVASYELLCDLADYFKVPVVSILKPVKSKAA